MALFFRGMPSIFVIDVFAGYIVGWRVSRAAHTSFVLDALEQALHQQRPRPGGRLIRYSDRGSQYVSIKYTDRLVQRPKSRQEIPEYFEKIQCPFRDPAGME